MIAARIEAADRRRRGSGFSEVTLALASRRITQGSGRGIRTIADKALLVPCDPRGHCGSSLAKRYASTIENCLPPAPITQVREDALAWVGNLNLDTNHESRVHVESDAEESVA